MSERAAVPPPLPAQALPPLELRPSAGRVFGGVWWLTFKQFATVNQLLFTLGIMAVVFLVGFTATFRDTEHNFHGWLENFYFLLLAPLLVFVSSGGAMRDQMKPAAADYIFTRPVRRWLYVIFRYIAQVAMLSLVYLPILATALAVGVIRDIPEIIAYAPRLLGTQELLILAVSGFGFFFGALTSRYIVIGLAYGFIIEMGLGSIPTQIARLSMSRHVRTLVEPFTENLTASGTFAAVTTLIVFAVVTLALAALIIQRHEFAGGRGKDV
ncbi:MAG TPA: hypothetical protein VFT72_05675 [Opitutaceae bacterium]|nr:hypothetical protein [Opitutaceae bacterium]